MADSVADMSRPAGTEQREDGPPTGRYDFPPPCIRPALPEDAQDLIPLMIGFSQVEEISWNPEPMTAALRQLLRNRELGVVMIVRTDDGKAAGYAIATFGFDIEFGDATRSSPSCLSKLASAGAAWEARC